MDDLERPSRFPKISNHRHSSTWPYSFDSRLASEREQKVSGYDLKDYVDVKQRIKLFIDKYPDGSLQFEFKGMLESNPDMIWGIAMAFREQNDNRPGVGIACELAIGKTSFTRGSELMNLETSAWGRAIAALGIGLENGIASRQEVKGSQDRNSEPPLTGDPSDNPKLTDPNNATPAQVKLITQLFNGNIEEMKRYVNDWKTRQGYEETHKLSKFNAIKLIDELKSSGFQAIPRRTDEASTD